MGTPCVKNATFNGVDYKCFTCGFLLSEPEFLADYRKWAHEQYNNNRASNILNQLQFI